MPEEIACDQARLMIESDLYAKLPFYLVISTDGDIIEPLRSQHANGEAVGLSVFTNQTLATESLASWSGANAKVQRFETQQEFRAILWIITRFTDLKWIALNTRTDDPIATRWIEIEAILTSKESHSEDGRQ